MSGRISMRLLSHHKSRPSSSLLVVAPAMPESRIIIATKID